MIDNDIRITFNLSRLTIDLPDTETDLQSLERLAESLNESIGDWLALEREQQRTCPKCDINHRFYERHDLERCPYCHRKIMTAKPLPETKPFKIKILRKRMQSSGDQKNVAIMQPGSRGDHALN
jgi:hypothetical protein